MKLYYASASPYARKVRAAAEALGAPLQLIATNATALEGGYGAVNPINRIPALEREDGTVLFDSPVICEYLDTRFEGTLLPREGDDRWSVLMRQALGDGLMDAAVPRRHECLRPQAQQSPERLALYLRSINQILAHLDSRTGDLEHFDLGTIAIACALGYLDFRFPQDEWRARHPVLGKWHDAFERHPALQAVPFM